MVAAVTAGDRVQPAVLSALADGRVDDTDAAFLAAIAAAMPALLVVVDLEGRFLWVNRTIPGIERADVLGRSIFDFTPTDDRATARAALARVRETGQPDHFVGFGPGKRGPRSRYQNWLAPIAPAGEVIAVAMITRDVSEDWELYDALRDREQRLSLVLDAAGMGTWRFELATATLELDDRARAIYGAAAGRVDGRIFTATHIHVDDRAAAQRVALDAFGTRRSYTAENRIVRGDGAIRWVAITGSPVIDEADQVVALMGTVTDVTVRREHESRARQAQRLEAVGQLTAGIAHNFNNMLAAIIPALAMVEREVPPPLAQLTRGAAQAATRAAELVRELMTLAGYRREARRAIEAPATIVEHTLQLCQSTFERTIAIVVDVAAGLPAVEVDAGQIEQAVLNLLLNARDAVRGRPEAMVAMRVGPAVDPDAPGRPMVAFIVEDNGPGIAPKDVERVFDPFFTTKEIGAGTGLGLSTAYAIAREHGGGLRYEPRPGGGARFVMVLPVSATPISVSAAAPAAPARGRGTVLVVDDEGYLRDAVRALLDAAGFVTAGADRGEAALAALAEQPAQVVLLDVNMPGRPWRDLVLQLRARHPTVKIVVFTGAALAPDEALVDGWLAKPATPDEIIAALVRVLPR
jgi:PAS domain S-box-containing protein